MTTTLRTMGNRITPYQSDLPPSLTHEHRRYGFARVPGAWFGAVLWIVQSEHLARAEHDVYAVEEMPPDYPSPLYETARYFLLCKCDPVKDECAGLYLVTIYHSLLRPPTCQCFGFSKWHTCKHVDCLFDLHQRERL